MAVSAAFAAVAVSAGGAYISNKNSKKAQAQAREAQEQNLAASEKTAASASAASAEANNKANQKRANSSALLSSNQMAGKGGQSGTMLTGPGGVDPSTLQLGRTTLLGGAG